MKCLALELSIDYVLLGFLNMFLKFIYSTEECLLFITRIVENQDQRVMLIFRRPRKEFLSLAAPPTLHHWVNANTCLLAHRHG